MTADTDIRIARLLHHRKAGLSLGEPVVPPISVATTFHLPQAQGAAHYYARSGQPTWDAVEAQLAILEAAEFTPRQLRQMVADGEIRDANTLAIFARMTALRIIR